MEIKKRIDLIVAGFRDSGLERLAYWSMAFRPRRFIPMYHAMIGVEVY